MKKLLFITMAALLIASCGKKNETTIQNPADSVATTQDTTKTAEIAGNWFTNMEDAVAAAQKENKNILVDFTGSDWCGWCIKLKDEVFSQKAFTDFAAQNLILVEIDFPKQKEQSETVKKYNNDLAKKYDIQGFPTIILLDKNGNKVDQTGYQEGGAESYVTHLKSLLKIK